MNASRFDCLTHSATVSSASWMCFSPSVCVSPSTDLCSVDNGGCSHNCSIIPGEGYMCSCPLGMELGPNNKTCQIQSFCAKHLKCSQKCEQEKSSVKCSCYEGWELEADMESCKSTGKDPELCETVRFSNRVVFYDRLANLLIHGEMDSLSGDVTATAVAEFLGFCRTGF